MLLSMLSSIVAWLAYTIQKMYTVTAFCFLLKIKCASPCFNYKQWVVFLLFRLVILFPHFIPLS